MKTTGIIRRVDDLGRVVIPREIRRTLHIREGEPLEIFIDDSGVKPMVCFQKYSCFDANDAIICALTETLRAHGTTYAIFSTSECITSNCCLFPKGTYTPTKLEDIRYDIYDNDQKAVIAPILNEGELFGWVMIFGEESSASYDLASFVAIFLSRQFAI